MADLVQPVTGRRCCSALCENTNQLLNIQCKCCEDNRFSQKHYMCMECYLNLIHFALKENREPVCPLDRSTLTVATDLLRLVEKDILMERMWNTIYQYSAEITTINLNHPIPMRTNPVPTRVRRVRIHSRDGVPARAPLQEVTEQYVQSAPTTPVANVREPMGPTGPSPTATDIRGNEVPFPYWTPEQLDNIDTNPEIRMSILEDMQIPDVEMTPAELQANQGDSIVGRRLFNSP